MQKRFVILELVFVVVMLVASGLFFASQYEHFQRAERDNTRKTAINALYYSLEKYYLPKEKSYPLTLTREALPIVDPTLFNDPSGSLIGDSSSEYRYEPSGCNATGCQSYTLRAALEAEADYIKRSPQN